jgi:hypothetical protein
MIYNGGSILGLSVDAQISYGNPPDAMITDRISGLRFTEAAKEFKQGDKNQVITLPFVALKLTNQTA